MRSILLATLVLSSCANAGSSVSSDAGPDDIGSVDAGPGDDSDAAPECSTTCSVQFRYPLEAGIGSVELRGSMSDTGWETGVSLTRGSQYWEADVELDDRQFVEYKYVIDGGDWVLDPLNRSQLPDGKGNVNSVVQADCGCQQDAFDWRDAILYFVFVDRFNDGDSGNNSQVANVPWEANYQGGDLAGVTQKIESGYFEDLGINVLWLTSPFDNSDAPGLGADGRNYSGYHGYWPRDMEKIDSHVGTTTDLTQLVDAAHSRDIKVILDYAMNHVHDQSPLYSEHNDWFWPNSNGNGGDCVCGDGCSWEGDDGRRCWFRNYLPDFNFSNPDARNWSVDNAIKWIKDTGIDGYRLDAIKHIENSWLYDLRKRVREEIESVSGERFYMVGETYSPDPYLISSYVDPLAQLDGQFDFPLRAELSRIILRRSGSMNELASFLNNNADVYHPGAIMSTFIGNHDLPRVIHAAEDAPLFGDWDSGQNRAWDNKPGQPNYRAPYERMGLAFAFLLTSPGIPLIYYGDEIGLAGAGDPDNRRFMTWDTVNEHQEWLRSFLSTLTTLRAEEVALRRGTREVLRATTDTIVYKMVSGNSTIIVALNRGDEARHAEGVPGGSYTNLLSSDAVTLPLSLPPRSVAVLKKN